MTPPRRAARAPRLGGHQTQTDPPSTPERHPMIFDQTTLDQMEAHAPYVIFLIGVLALGVGLTIAALAEARANRRERRR